MQPSTALRFRAEKEAALTTALTRLGAARRERLTAEDLEVYADGLRPFPLEAVVAVCRTFEKQTPAEFGPRYPALGDIVQGVRDQLTREQTQREMTTRRLTEAHVPLSPEKLQELRDKFNALVGSKSMTREPGQEG